MGHHGKSCKNSSQYDAIHHLSKEQVIYESLLNKLESLDPHPLLPNNLASQFLSLYLINNHNHQIKHSSNTTKILLQEITKTQLIKYITKNELIFDILPE
jgi:hypothetical protein